MGEVIGRKKEVFLEEEKKVKISCQHLEFFHTKSDSTCPVYILIL